MKSCRNQVGQGKDNTRKFLEQNPKILDEVEAKVKEKVCAQV